MGKHGKNRPRVVSDQFSMNPPPVMKPAPEDMTDEEREEAAQAGEAFDRQWNETNSRPK